MLKRISISSYTPLKTAAVLLALATGVFSSRADHFLWSEFDTTVNAPAETSGYDDEWEWDYGSTYGQNEQGGQEGGCSWGDSITTWGWADDNPTWDEAVSGGQSFYIAASIDSEISGDWVSDESGPPESATVYYSASIFAGVEAETLVRQVIDPTNGDNGDVNYFMAGAGAGVDYALGTTGGLPTFGEQMLAVNGGMTNGVPNSSLGGGASYFGPAEILPQSFTAAHDYQPDELQEQWKWEQYVQCYLSVSDSYTLPVDSVSASVHMESISTADIVLNTDLTTSYRVYAYIDASAGISGNFGYGISPNY